MQSIAIREMKVTLYREKPIAIVEGGPGFCPKVKGGRRYQAEVLQEMCRKCRVKGKHCPHKLKKGGGMDVSRFEE